MRKTLTINNATKAAAPIRVASKLRRMILPLALGTIAGSVDAVTIPTVVGSLVSSSKQEIVANLVSSTKPSWLLKNWSVEIAGVVKVENGDSGSAVLHLPVMENGRPVSFIFDGANSAYQFLVDGELPQDFAPVPSGSIPVGYNEIRFTISIFSPNASTQRVKFSYTKPSGEEVVQPYLPTNKLKY